MLLQAALNGPFGAERHPAVPVTAEALARDAAACVAAGAGAIHLHPRDASGAETLDPATVDAVVAQVRGACEVPVGVSTHARIEADPRRRAALVAGWTAPDYASVNVSEAGWSDVMRALLDAGIGIEAGVWSVADADALAASGLADRVLRVLVEVRTDDEPVAIHAALDAGAVTAPRLQHGEEASAWTVLDDALRRGVDTRIGFEDTVHDPRGALALGNAALVRAAAERL